MQPEDVEGSEEQIRRGAPASKIISQINTENIGKYSHLIERGLA